MKHRKVEKYDEICLSRDIDELLLFFSKFIHEELGSKTDAVRHRHFQNADLQITVKDLWTQWQDSAGK